MVTLLTNGRAVWKEAGCRVFETTAEQYSFGICASSDGTKRIPDSRTLYCNLTNVNSEMRKLTNEN
jgi:hypothetical protein